MAIVTVFRSRLRPGIADVYVVVANEMSRLARSMDGFLEEKMFLAPDGERVTIVRFADMESQRTWAKHPDHLIAQRRGREEFYSWYSITVAEEEYTREFENHEQ
ncbi:MAG TPA: antibiotic biosynthesis monooxygenase [Acidimicrobiales bacterium]